jgi:DNA-binding PadR family transcriptional regulator
MAITKTQSSVLARLAAEGPLESFEWKGTFDKTLKALERRGYLTSSPAPRPASYKFRWDYRIYSLTAKGDAAIKETK